MRSQHCREGSCPPCSWGSSLFFGHHGRDEGNDASVTAWAEMGQGLVIMINANDNSRRRGIDRHGGQVARIAYYSVTTDTGKHYFMVHLTQDNLVTGFDLVDN